MRPTNMLHKKKILIIGGSSGIGLGIASVCADYGADTIIAGRCKQKLSNATAFLDNRITGVQIDANNDNCIDAVYQQIGCFDHLVISAGEAMVKSLQETTEEDARGDMERNFWLKYKLSTRALPYLSKEGSILFISGIFSVKPNANLFMSSVSVGAVEALCKSLAISAAPIRVNAIAPYVVDNSDSLTKDISDDRKNYLQSIASKIPAGNVGKTRDVGLAAVMLMKNQYASGTILNLDGAYSLT
ncbi:hypothetical protein C2869_07080 [Saccharobesus litoralis]|uniref:Uncharacterized protein n=1 Tax=Saccharobesus litoralis TaxID=2172099 RepID=A0A2S0VPV1_9ALTE|nr:SDR family oxidoreductase [Saccharobesus litoralis]AWB66212.1 hypothetical protein C2869_07080 [Saccharobesus litoralis]